MPQPAQQEQHNVHAGNGNAEHDSSIGLTAHSSLTEVGVHNAHGYEVEEKVPPVQVSVLP